MAECFNCGRNASACDCGKPKSIAVDPMKVATRAIRDDLAYWKRSAEESVAAHAREIDRLSSDLAAARTRMALLEQTLNHAWEHHCGGEHHPCEHDHIDDVIDDLLGAMFNDGNDNG